MDIVLYGGAAGRSSSSGAEEARGGCLDLLAGGGGGATDTSSSDAIARVHDGSFATCYAGFQFGKLVGQLGDGRSVTVLETALASGLPCEVQLKGGTKTPYSRSFDGLYPVGAAVKEYIVSHVLHGSGVPCSPALALLVSERRATREAHDDARAVHGPSTVAPRTAVLVRCMTSSLRVGTFEALFYTRKHDELKQLADFAIRAHFPHLLDVPADGDENASVVLSRARSTIATTSELDAQQRACGSEVALYLRLVTSVAKRFGALTAHWIAHGFVHGVMNTDNMSIHGETIDIGPCCFVDAAVDDFTLNPDDPTGVYAFGAQAAAGHRAAERFAMALSPLFTPERGGPTDVAAVRAALRASLEQYWVAHRAVYLAVMCEKLGIDLPAGARSGRVDEVIEATVALHRRLWASARVRYDVFFHAVSVFAALSSQQDGSSDTTYIARHNFTTTLADVFGRVVIGDAPNAVNAAAVAGATSASCSMKRGRDDVPVLTITSEDEQAIRAWQIMWHGARRATGATAPRNPRVLPTAPIINHVCDAVEAMVDAAASPRDVDAYVQRVVTWLTTLSGAPASGDVVATEASVLKGCRATDRRCGCG